MGYTADPYGSAPSGSTVGTGLVVLKRSPVPNQIDVEPDATVSMSIRDYSAKILSAEVYIDDVLAWSIAGGFEEGYSGKAKINAFYGRDVSITHPDFSVYTTDTHKITVTAADALGFVITEEWLFLIRQACFDTLRLAFPNRMREYDPNIIRFFKIWDGITCLVRKASSAQFKGAALFDVDTIRDDLLEVAFEDAGLVYPNFSEVSFEKKRRILRNANEVHSLRYSVPGLQFYLSLLTDATVSVAKLNRGLTLFFNSEQFGFPTPEMMISSGTDNDICTYFIGQVAQEIVITITGDLSDDMKEFLRETIYREIPMSDDPNSPVLITIIFV